MGILDTGTMGVVKMNVGKMGVDKMGEEKMAITHIKQTFCISLLLLNSTN